MQLCFVLCNQLETLARDALFLYDLDHTLAAPSCIAHELYNLLERLSQGQSPSHAGQKLEKISHPLCITIVKGDCPRKCTQAQERMLESSKVKQLNQVLTMSTILKVVERLSQFITVHKFRQST
eukprot:4530869-Amphidinium_carterae.1